MDYGDYYWGFYRDYYGDPFPHSLLSTRKLMVNVEQPRRRTALWSPSTRSRPPAKPSALVLVFSAVSFMPRYTILGVPYYNHSITGPKTLF